MSLFLFSVSLGNFFTAGINRFIAVEEPEKTEVFAGNGVSYLGADKKLGTEDDAMRQEEGILTRGLEAIELVNGKFPQTVAAFESLRDPWGNPLRYHVMNSRTARISSDGPDQENLTKWDQGVVITLPEVEVEQKKSWSDAWRPEEAWLTKRKRELGLLEKSSDEDNPYPFTTEYYSGGGTRLEGASYFWFFAGLMLVTAIGFIPYALRYRGKTILQDSRQDASASGLS